MRHGAPRPWLVDRATRDLLRKAFDTVRHPRYPKGHPRGGQFRPSGVARTATTTTTAEAPADVEDAAEQVQSILRWELPGRQYTTQPDQATAVALAAERLRRRGDGELADLLEELYAQARRAGAEEPVPAEEPPDELEQILESVLGWREYEEQPDEATALRAALHYLRRDGDLWMVEYLLHHYGDLLDDEAQEDELRATLEATGAGTPGADVMAVPDLPAWAAPEPGAPTGEELLGAALEAGMPVTDEPVTFSTWLLENGQYLNMVSPEGNPAHHDDVVALFGPDAPQDGRHQARFALRTGALRVFLPALESETMPGAGVGTAYVMRLDAGQPITEAQTAALRRLLAQAEGAQIERRVVGREGSADRAWDVRVGGGWEDRRRTAGYGLRMMAADCRDPASGAVRAPAAPGAGNAPRPVETRGLRKAVLVFGLRMTSAARRR